MFTPTQVRNWRIQGTAAVLSAALLLPVMPATADSKSRNWKTGAVILGAASAYMILKGKTLPGAAAGAGAYYAYKKGRDANREEHARNQDDYWYSRRDDGPYDNDYRGGRRGERRRGDWLHLQ